MTLNKNNNPIELFNQWYSNAQKSQVSEPDAMNLATATKNGIPSNRMVLLKEHNDNGFVFYTNLESRKGNELNENPFASLCFYWKEIGQQIRIEGKITPVSDEEADTYFNSRPLESRIGACVSQQSRPIQNRFDLIKEVSKKSLKTPSIKRPTYWSGFRLSPNKIEFWEKGSFRIHKRTLYSLIENKWVTESLYP